MLLYKKDFLIINTILAALLLFTSGCSKLAPTSSLEHANTAISASIQMPHRGLAVNDLTRIVLLIAQTGSDTIRKELTLSGSGATGKVDVPVGKDLVFIARAFKDSVKVLEGSTKFKPEKDKKNSLSILLQFAVPAIILTPPDSSLQKDDTFTIYLEARKVTDIAVIGARVVFDTSFVQVADLGREDDFLTSKSGSVTQMAFTKDNEKGSVDIVLGVFPASAAVTSSDGSDSKVAKILFKARKAGETQIKLMMENSLNPDLGLFDKNGDLVSNSLALGSHITIQ